MRIRVSDIAQFASCPKRSKLQGLRQVNRDKSKKEVRVKGTKMHTRYSLPYKSFYRRVLIYKLKEFAHVFTRQIGKVEMRGIPDDYRVLCVYNGTNQLMKKVVSIVEVKTTNRKRLWTNEIAVAVLQLQLYIWLMKPYFDILDYELHSRHYLEVYSQKTDKLIKRVMVKPLEYPEKKISYIIETWRGLGRMAYPPKWICKRCPKNVKKQCWRWEEINEHNRLLH